MATRIVKIDRIGRYSETNTRYWEGLLNGDDGSPLEKSGWSDVTVQAVGVFGPGDVTIQGSLDGNTWATLQDVGGTDMVLTDSSLVTVRQNCNYIRPVVANGDGTTALSVYLLGA